AAQTVRMRALNSLIQGGQDLSSGLWFRDERSFINVREARVANLLNDVRIYQFDSDYRLRLLTLAASAEYAGACAASRAPSSPRRVRAPSATKSCNGARRSVRRCSTC